MYRKGLQSDFCNRFTWFGGNNLLISFSFIGGQGTKDRFEDREEYLGREMRNVGVETVQMKSVQSMLD